MHLYPDTFKDWFSGLFSGYLWHGSRNEKKVYLTFDDGPDPEVTQFVLEQLDNYDFKATFFCIGDCVQRHPQVYQELLTTGNQVGNHTYHHLNNWKTNTDNYLKDVEKASEVIDSKLFRPPYGRITPKTARLLRTQDFQIVMWDVLSGDFDIKRSAESCLKNLKKNTRKGSIIVFHDSEKAYEKLQVILPEYLDYLKSMGFEAATISYTA